VTRRRLNRRQTRRVRLEQQRRREHAEGLGSNDDAALAASEANGEALGGTIVSRYGAHLAVEDEGGRLHDCTARQHLGALVCGDRVAWQAVSDGLGVVTVRLERKSALVRPGYDGSDRALAANVDRIIIVAAPRPELSEALIDRYLVAAELTGIAPLILLNKLDLLAANRRSAVLRRLDPYRNIGYELCSASTHAHHGLDELVTQLRGHTSVLVGQSGVGKSSLIKALLPDREVRTGELSPTRQLGRHTTTTAMLYRLPQGGALIDSPGVRNFHLWNVAPESLGEGFREFREHLGHCQFRNCKHLLEPRCALREAVGRGAIEARRFDSYLEIRTALEEARRRRQ